MHNSQHFGVSLTERQIAEIEKIIRTRRHIESIPLMDRSAAQEPALTAVDRTLCKTLKAVVKGGADG